MKWLQRIVVNPSKLSSSKGFTLIELVLVIGLLAVTVGVTSSTLVSLVSSYGKSQVKAELEQQANFVSLKLEKELRSANNVTSPDTTTLSFTDSSGVAITYVVTADGLIQRNGQDITYNAVPGGVSVTCIGACFSVVGTKPVVVNLGLRFSQAQAVASTNYAGTLNIINTIVVRSTY